jgi:uncharacterized protein GlcG (DUF336 family)
MTITCIDRVSLTTVPLDSATAATEAGIAKGASLGAAFTITVVDAGGFLVAAHRMDGAALASIELSASKATTALLFAQPTRDLVDAVQPGAPLFGMDAATRTPLAFMPGGVPLTDADGTVIGAVGAGGGTPDEDHEVAAAAAALMKPVG